MLSNNAVSQSCMATSVFGPDGTLSIKEKCEKKETSITSCIYGSMMNSVILEAK